MKHELDFAAWAALANMRMVARVPSKSFVPRVDGKKKKRRKIAAASKRRNRK